jgi:hypothetical protein
MNKNINGFKLKLDKCLRLLRHIFQKYILESKHSSSNQIFLNFDNVFKTK